MLKNIYLFFDKIPGYSTGSITNNEEVTQMVITTRYSVIFQKILSRVRVAQKIPSSLRVAGTRWGLNIINEHVMTAESQKPRWRVGIANRKVFARTKSI